MIYMSWFLCKPYSMSEYSVIFFTYVYQYTIIFVNHNVCAYKSHKTIINTRSQCQDRVFCAPSLLARKSVHVWHQHVHYVSRKSLLNKITHQSYAFYSNCDHHPFNNMQLWTINSFVWRFKYCCWHLRNIWHHTTTQVVCGYCVRWWICGFRNDRGIRIINRCIEWPAVRCNWFKRVWSVCGEMLGVWWAS